MATETPIHGLCGCCHGIQEPHLHTPHTIVQCSPCDSKTKAVDEDHITEIEPFLLLETKRDLLEAYKLLESDIRIVDAYPSTPLQEGLVALSMKQDGIFIPQIICRLSADIDIPRFKAAWQTCVKNNSTLRTVFIQPKNVGLIQVVLEPKEIEWHASSNLEDYLSRDRAIRPDFGSNMLRYAIVIDPESQSKHFVWTFHHAVIDGWAMKLLLEQVDQFYKCGTCNPLVEFNVFIKYINARAKMSSKSSAQFWTQHLNNYASRAFPPLSTKESPEESSADSSMCLDLNIPKSLTSVATHSTIIQAAWALLIARYTDAKEATYGMVLAGRNLDLAGIKRINGPTFTTVPMRVVLHNHQTPLGLFEVIHETRRAMKPHQHVGLQNIRRFGPDAAKSCSFENLLVIQPKQVGSSDSLFNNRSNTSDHWARLNAYALMMQCDLADDGFVANASFDSKRIPRDDIRLLLRQFQNIILQFSVHPRAPLESIQLLRAATNAIRVPATVIQTGAERVDACIHEIISRNSQGRMSNQAIVSWDGEMTYRELDRLSDLLGHRLRQSKVGPEVVVALMFERSMWAIVSMIAVLKAGGVFVSLDPTHPRSRLQVLMEQTGANFLLCSDKFSGTFSTIAQETIGVHKASLEGLPAVDAKQWDIVRPENACYVIFTSGSSGTPKGCVIEHSTCSTTSHYLSAALGMDSTTRMLQISSYTFDACILEILITLSVGGCICIPSEHEKMNNVVAAINLLQANCSFMTPSFARLIEPDSIPTLRTLSIGGEQLVHDDLDRWVGKVRLFEGYGPTECCVVCIVNEVRSKGIDPSIIGSPILGSYTIVDEAMNQVQPGSIGELLIGGPQLARGYLNDTAKTKASFIPTPHTLQQEGSTCKRWYKTGDLVRWNIDSSSFKYIRRKDTQVKINGQRIETGEIESHMRKKIPNLVDIAVVVANPVERKAFLAAFIYQAPDPSDDLLQEYCSTRLVRHNPLSLSTIKSILDGLHQILPRYMIPKVYIPLNYMPHTTSGKTDRKSLEAYATQLSPTDLLAHSGHQIDYSHPATEKEICIQQLWSTILHIGPDTISKHHNFIRLGGDSILAMRLVAEAREAGLVLSVAKVFKSSTLSELAEVAEVSQNQIEDRKKSVPAFSLVKDQATLSLILNDQSKCYSETIEICDIYPCTPFQQGIMALSISHPGTYVAQHVFQLSNELVKDLKNFRAAWDTVVAATPILRTKILQTEASGLMQAVTNEKIIWRSHDDLGKFLRMDKSVPFQLGAPLSRYAIITCTTGTLSQIYFVWTMHHACYDAWSMRLTLQHVEETYMSKACGKIRDQRNHIPFNIFVDIIQNFDVEEGKSFWEAKLGEGEPVIFPATAAGYRPRPNAIVEHDISFERKEQSNLRTSSLIRAAWAITIGTYANADDVVFGATLSGRTGPYADLTSIVGPTITTVPVRTHLDPQLSVADFLRSVEASEIEAMPFEQLGLSRIRLINERVKAACNFQNLLVIQPKVDFDIDGSFLGQRVEKFINADVFDTYALIMECSVEPFGLKTKAIYDPNVVPEVQLRRVVRHFEHILQQLCHEEADKSIYEINTISPVDASDIQRWNAKIPAPMEICVHNLVEKTMLQNPHAAAICSWDGDLTRGELDRIVSKLAQELIRRGMGVGSKVPVLFNKSKWAVVAILAIIKAGAAFVPLDPRNPVQRLVSIISQLDTSIILCSTELGELCSVSFPEVKTVIISDLTVAHLSDETVPSSQVISPEDDLYIIFTSGSTGDPKGTCIQHGAYCAGARDHAKALCFDETSRFLQFASYSFDTSVEDILTTLMTGGCLCIPSEEERSSDIIGAISRMNVNTADLTPSFVSSISPDDVPSLRRLILGGEPLTSKAITTWANRVHLINGYGTTECCVTNLVNSNISRDTSPSNIGNAVGAVSWVVDPTNSSRILPIGAIGELIIEGPAIAKGYLNDPERTSRCFIDSLKFNTPLVRSPGRHYKTGDLVKYNPDSSINYIGRKDTRIKLRGQRIELGDIEHHLLSHPDVRNVLVVLPSSGPYKDTITALVEFEHLLYSGKIQNTEIVQDARHEGQGFNWNILSEHLRERVPSYMVPLFWIAIEKLPLHTSGKLDRSRLGAWIHGLTARFPTLHEPEDRQAQPIPKSDTIAMEISKLIADMFPAEISKKETTFVGFDAKLADVGIDSIKVMSLAAGMKRIFSVIVPVSILVSHKTKISDIADYIKKSRAGVAPVQNLAVDLLEEFRLRDFKLESLQCRIGVVFLTGGTGYLGTQILRQLVAHPGVNKVVAHVRALNAQNALQRLEDAAQAAQWSTSGFVSKLEVWTGDLSKTMLGLTQHQWSQLGNVDAIIHNGASVNWTSDYHALKAANVDSTFEILRAIHHSQLQTKLVYVTGGRSFDPSEKTESTLAKLSTLDGYSQSKFLAEALVKRFAQREARVGRSPHISIVEPGLVMGTSQEGIANAGDFIWRYVAGAIRLGLYPLPDKSDWLEISSADRVARSTIDSLLQTQTEPGAKIKMVDGIGMQDFWNAVIAHAGYHIQPVSAQEWKSRVQIQINQETEAHPLWPVAHLISPEGNLGKSTRAKEVGSGGRNEELLRIIGKNVDSLVRSGFLNAREAVK